MAYVHPGGTTQGFAAVALRHGTRFVAVMAYAVAVAVAFVLLWPVLPGPGSEAPAVVPANSQPVLYKIRPGDTLQGIAATQGVSLSQLYALNPDLTPLKDAAGTPVVVALR
jgi:LysM domain